ncbi:GNAT family N-acetyltransferase [Clostridium sp. KNHs216]|uniref:GNAT family N-acetyltransferase n=1 Tax=Clostridium sp. KNHs216 TaxID=1550235 RepID=UPI00114FEBB5|nr:GNAT family N-acetyltransferase [Clostridium sp. KNHs216]TQI66202.1 acetyltransferase (GNAT) family protein [Clostridium sp. KNHs216]
MKIRYTEEKNFTRDQVQELFLSVDWVSGQYPDRLHKALRNSSTVITAWNEDRLVGLARALDDSELVAYVHYVLVHPEFQGHGIAKELLNRVKDKYKNFLYIELMPEEKKNVSFYKKLGFQVMPEGTAMLLANYSHKN